MNPAFVRVAAPHSQPQSLARHKIRLVTAEKLGDLGGANVGLAQHRGDRRYRGDAVAQCSGQSTRGADNGDGGTKAPFAVHFSHNVTPRKLQMMQTNVPHPAHGYPSDARS
jgi:hypothetical protein